LFDREGLPGPWALTETGDVVSTAEAHRIQFNLGEPIALRGVSNDGHRLVVGKLGSASKANSILLDLGSRYHPILNGPAQARAAGRDLYLALEPNLPKTIEHRNMRCRFQGIGVDESGRLMLVARRGHHATIDLVRDESLELLPWGVAAEKKWQTRVRDFKSIPTPHGARFDLKVATWSDGSRAFLDSRGLLHLMSSDRSLPEISLVLGSDGIAGWVSDGRVWGPTYYKGLPLDEDEISWNDILEFAARLR
jgi:hypothetical protein